MQYSQSKADIIRKVQETLSKYEIDLWDINQKIWKNPEPAFQEHNAHDNICAFFETLFPNRFEIHRGAYGVETAFEITYTHGHGGRVVAFNAEYDALPNIGHACGHNLIATSSIASFIATCETMAALYSDKFGFSVRLLGTPAEEGGGGKVCLIDAGAYKDVDACLMVHPFPLLTGVDAGTLASSMCTGMYLAVSQVRVTYTGKPAHAAAAPWEGVNALDAIVSAYVNISMLRQQIRPSERIHGIVANGGDRPNVIPHATAVEYCIRSESIESLKPLVDKVRKCFEAAATATGCTMEFETNSVYTDLKDNHPMCESFASVMNIMGHEVLLDAAGHQGVLSGGSTDMGNVTYEVPGFHGGVYIATDGVNHTPEFTAGAGSRESFQRSLSSSAGMAVVGCQVLTDDSFAAAVQADFQGRTKSV